MTTLKELSNDLEGLFNQDKKPSNEDLQTLLKAYSAKGEDYQSYIHFNDIHYTRNLVHHNDKFELMVLCWKDGQASRIHSHTNSDCWMTVLDGKVEETRYVCKDGNHVKELVFPGPCPELQQIEHFESGKGDVGHISDDVGLHRVAAAPGTHAITLHLYAPPITESRILEPETGTTTRRTPGFYSMFGQRQQVTA